MTAFLSKKSIFISYSTLRIFFTVITSARNVACERKITPTDKIFGMTMTDLQIFTKAGGETTEPEKYKNNH